MAHYYISIPLNAHPIANEIENSIKQADPNLNKLAWQPKSNFHITLASLGNISLKQQEQKRIATIADSIIKKYPCLPFNIESANPIEFGNNGCFGKLMVNSGGNLEKLQAEIVSELKQLGISSNALKPHITIARQKGAFGSQTPFNASEKSFINMVGNRLAGKQFQSNTLEALFRVNSIDLKRFQFLQTQPPIRIVRNQLSAGNNILHYQKAADAYATANLLFDFAGIGKTGAPGRMKVVRQLASNDFTLCLNQQEYDSARKKMTF